MYGSVQIGKHLDVSDGTIRNWSAEFAAYLAPGSQTNTPGEFRTFTPDDLIILETVATLRRQNKSYDDIQKALANGERLEVDAPPIDVKPNQEAALAIVAFQATLQNYENRIDKMQERLEEERAARLSAEIRAAQSETEVRLLRQNPLTWWQRMRGRD